jgi:hypothetical protein
MIMRTTELASCPVTLPQESPLKDFRGSDVYWKGELFVAGLPPDGTLVFRPGGASAVSSRGSLRRKFGWYRGPGLRGRLYVTGRRLDAIAAPLRAQVPTGYGATGFQASALIFPSVGCWEIAGTVDHTSVTFVLRVTR